MTFDDDNLDFMLKYRDRFSAEMDLLEYTKQAWHAIEPGVKFQSGWVVGAIAEHLQAITDGQIKRLVINVPPGCTKSMMTNVMWPSWEWGPRKLPHHRFISASYEQGLATRDLVRGRDLILSEWYQSQWPIKFKEDANEKTYYANTSTGWRMSVGVRGALTGHRGDRIIVDDPHDVQRAESEVLREESLRWFTETLPTRLNKALGNEDSSAIVVIMQRLHERDISGYILKELGDTYTQLIIPMRYENDRHCSTKVISHATVKPFTDPRTVDGDLAWPKRFPEEAVAELEETFEKGGGGYAIAAQLQQRPSPRGGGMFKRDNFVIVDTPSDMTNSPIVSTVRGWDLAGSTRKRSPYTAGVKMVKHADGTIGMHDAVFFKKTSGIVRQKILKTAKLDGKQCIQDIPQDPGQAGKDQVRSYGQLLDGFIMRFSPESGDKVLRAEPFAAQVECGNVYMIRGEWNDRYLGESELFPAGEFKDGIDASSRAHGRLSRRRSGSMRDAVAPKLKKG